MLSALLSPIHLQVVYFTRTVFSCVLCLIVRLAIYTYRTTCYICYTVLNLLYNHASLKCYPWYRGQGCLWHKVACFMRGFLFISGTDPVGHLFATAKDVNKAVESLVQVMTSDDEAD